MDKNIKTILNDLYQLDESLKKHETELVELITVLIKAKPHVSWDENFKNDLRAQLLQKFSSLSHEEKPKANFMNKFIYILGGATLGLLIFLPYAIKENKQSSLDLAMNANINKVSNNAFGSLVSLDLQNGLGAGDAVAPQATFQNEVTEESDMSAKGFGGGGLIMDGEDMGRAVSSVAVSDGATAPKDVMIMPNYKIYKYRYDGDNFTIDNDQMSVLRKVNNHSAQANLANIVSQANFDILDVSKFQNSKIQNFSLLEDKKFGYEINFNLQSGEIYINQNWEQWPTKEKGRVTIDQVPSNEKLFAVTDKFLNEYKINKQNYAEPIIEDDWAIKYEMSNDKKNFYIPNIMTVIYPQKFDDKIVYESSGSVAGLRMSVDVEEMKVSSVWSLGTQQYESSLYTMETDVARILKFAEQGGVYPIYEQPEAEIVEISLGTPTLEYVKSWQNEGRVSNQLYIPALVFPIQNQTEQDMLWKKNVVIPLAKEILDQNSNIPTPDIEPMPLLK